MDVVIENKTRTVYHLPVWAIQEGINGDPAPTPVYTVILGDIADAKIEDDEGKLVPNVGRVPSDAGENGWHRKRKTDEVYRPPPVIHMTEAQFEALCPAGGHNAKLLRALEKRGDISIRDDQGPIVDRLFRRRSPAASLEE